MLCFFCSTYKAKLFGTIPNKEDLFELCQSFCSKLLPHQDGTEKLLLKKIRGVYGTKPGCYFDNANPIYSTFESLGFGTFHEFCTELWPTVPVKVHPGKSLCHFHKGRHLQLFSCRKLGFKPLFFLWSTLQLYCFCPISAPSMTCYNFLKFYRRDLCCQGWLVY